MRLVVAWLIQIRDPGRRHWGSYAFRSGYFFVSFGSRFTGGIPMLFPADPCDSRGRTSWFTCRVDVIVRAFLQEEPKCEREE